MASEIHGNLLQLALAGRFDVIIHGCNCQCTMGAGIAKQIKAQFPEAYKADLRTVKGAEEKLGPVNTYAITATADVNRQCNEEGAARVVPLARRPRPQWRFTAPSRRVMAKNPPAIVANLDLGITKAGGSRLVRRIFDR